MSKKKPFEHEIDPELLAEIDEWEQQEHDEELRLFYMAERKLKGQVVDGKLPVAAWRAEKARLETEYKDLQQELTPLYADTKKLWGIHYSIYEVQHAQERQTAVTRQKKQEIEH